MLRHLCAALASAAAILSGAPAKAEPLQPTTAKWNFNFGTTQCIASRSYANGAEPLTLLIVPSLNGATYRILVAGKYHVSELASEEAGTVDFGDGPIKTSVLFYQTPDRSADVHQFRISAAEIARGRSASDLTLHMATSSDLTFAVSGMGGVLDALQDCTAKLQIYWNMGADESGRFSKPARGDLRSVFAKINYPPVAYRHWEEGKGDYLLLIDQTGKVAGCDVLTPTGVPILDAAACATIQDKAKFTPALDEAGKPVRSAVVTPSINFSLL